MSETHAVSRDLLKAVFMLVYPITLDWKIRFTNDARVLFRALARLHVSRRLAPRSE